MAKAANFVLRWSFYLLFFLVPLVFYSGSFELFEYNKMMLTYAFTIIIVTSWTIKIVASGQPLKASFHRTPFDVPLALYLGSHIISTLLSIDMHTSIWGFYSRFHEGLVATICYITLFYAAVNNLKSSDVLRIFGFSFVSSLIVSLWGISEHLGVSPSCVILTGSPNVTCWVQDVQNRVFATLGQPNWMAAFLDIIILLLLGTILHVDPATNPPKVESKFHLPPAPSSFSVMHLSLYFLLGLCFTALLFTKSRSGLLGLGAGLGVIGTFVIWRIASASKADLAIIRSLAKRLAVASVLLAFLAGLFGLPFSQIENLSVEKILSRDSTVALTTAPKTPSPYLDIGISESGDIRRIVWEGGLRVWQRYPIFGSGIETFAYAYYKDRPTAHNMVSEWDFLYNKAHNEFINILATTGTVGMIAYLVIIGAFVFWAVRKILDRSTPSLAYLAALLAAFISILVTNFFGFSVVIVGLFFFLIPGFALILARPEPSELTHPPTHSATPISPSPPPFSASKWLVIVAITFFALYLEWATLTSWLADKAYAYGKNLDGVQEYVTAYPYLIDAVNKRPAEPTFRDELSYNEAVLATLVYQQLNTPDSPLASATAEQKLAYKFPGFGLSVGDLVARAVTDSNEVVNSSPNSLPFWKTRTKMFYQLATIDSRYVISALDAIRHAAELGPTDAKIHYNYGLLLAQSGEVANAIKVFEETTSMKPDYRDAFYALGLYYNEAGQKEKARAQMLYVLEHIGPDAEAQKWLSEN